MKMNAGTEIDPSQHEFIFRSGSEILITLVQMNRNHSARRGTALTYQRQPPIRDLCSGEVGPAIRGRGAPAALPLGLAPVPATVNAIPKFPARQL
jgi:hypothetical protein